MSDAANIAIMEHLSLHSPLSIQDFCARFSSVFHLPEFHFDAENETEWGTVEFEHVEFNVSKPYEADTLRGWDSTVPFGCNFGISLILLRSHKSPTHEWALEQLETPVARALANEFSTTVYFHRTWLAPGQNIARHAQFHPNVA